MPSVIVNGLVTGDIYSSKHLELASKSRVQGNVFYTMVEMAAGAEVNGSLTHMTDTGEATEKPASAAESADNMGGKAPQKASLAKVD